MDKGEFTQRLKGLLAPWDRDLKAEALLMYFEALADVPDDKLREAFAAIAKDRKREHGQPTPADIRAVLYAAHRDASLNKPRVVAAPDVIGKLSRIVAECAFEERWHPSTPEEHEGCRLFTWCLHDAQGAIRDPNPFHRVKRPVLNASALWALSDIGGGEVLRELESHDVLMAREKFAKTYAAREVGAA